MTSHLVWNKGTPHVERRFKSRTCSVVVCALLALCAASSTRGTAQEKQEPAARANAASDNTAPANKIRLLLLADTSKLLTVHYETKGRVIRDLLMTSPLTGGIGTIVVDAAEQKHENSKESKILQRSVAEFDRRPAVEARIAEVFKDKTKYFDLIVPPDPSEYMTGKDINFSKVQAAGYPYVLWVKETFAGEATVAGLGTLSTGSALAFKVYDAATGKDMGKPGRASAYSPHKQEFDAATSDRNAFVTDYGVAVGAECPQVYGVINKQGHLHAMAEAHGLGSEVPDVGAIFAQYEKRFDYDFKLPKHWHHLKGPTKYSATLMKLFGDGPRFRVLANVDLMLPELGQKPGDMDEYIRNYFEGLQEKGYAADAATPFKGFTLDPAYTTYLVDRPRGVGKEIVAFRRLDAPFVVVYDVVFDSEYDELAAKYSSDLQTIINDSRIKIRE